MLIKIAARLEQAPDVDALWDGAVAALRTTGFRQAIYLTVDARFENPMLRCTLPDIYSDTRPQDDPFLRYACTSYDIVPIGTAFVDDHPYITAQERDFVERAGQAGVTAALGIPMRLRGRERFGGFILGTGMDRERFTRRILPRAERIRLFCLLIHRRMEELLGEDTASATIRTAPETSPFRSPMIAPDLPPKFDVLSPREREVVYLLALGRSRQQAAEICGISVHTVSDYAKSGYRKLGVHNRAQAAAALFAVTQA